MPDFEPNCFPSIEFDRADFPWLFTPARANTNGQLRWTSYRNQVGQGEGSSQLKFDQVIEPGKQA